jgi:hypothetical protein
LIFSITIVTERMKDGAFKKGQGAGGAPAHILGESHRGEEWDEERGEEIDELHLVGVLVFGVEC